jgi:lipid-A-disaccharide synthase
MPPSACEHVPGVRFVMPCANAERRAQIEADARRPRLPVTLLDGQSHLALAA